MFTIQSVEGKKDGGEKIRKGLKDFVAKQSFLIIKLNNIKIMKKVCRFSNIIRALK